METDRYFLLDTTLPGHHTHKMLGRVVVDKTNPLRHFAPYSNDPERPSDPLNMVPHLSDKPVVYNDMKTICIAAKSDDVKGKFTSLLSAYASQSTSTEVAVDAGIVTRYEMINVPVLFDQLLENETYRRQAKALFNEREGVGLFLVTGVLTCKDLKVRARDGDTKNGTLQTGLSSPAGEASDDDLEMGISVERGNGSGFLAVIKQEVVFALAYDEVRLDPPLIETHWTWLQFRWVSIPIRDPKLALGRSIRGRGIKLYLGEAPNAAPRVYSESHAADSLKGSTSMHNFVLDFVELDMAQA
jgi:hypothetical protein